MKIKPFFLLLLLCSSASFAATYKLSCVASFNPLQLKTQLSLRSLTFNPDNPDFDICLQEKTETYTVPNYYNNYYPSFNVGYGRYVGNRGFVGMSFDPFSPFYMNNNFNNNYNTTQTTNTLSLIIKDRQGATVWQDSYSSSSSKNSDQTLRTLIDKIPVSLAASANDLSEANVEPQPEHVYSSKDFEKKQLTPEEFEQIRLR